MQSTRTSAVTEARNFDASDLSWLDEIASGNKDTDLLRKALTCVGEEQKELFKLACVKRDDFFPEREVEVRSVVEISNVCKQGCFYCSISKDSGIKRYLIKKEVAEEIAVALYEAGRRVILLQSGENDSHKFLEYIADITQRICTSCPKMEVILCCGNFKKEDYKVLLNAGAKRYVLKFEASNPDLYEKSKPTDTFRERERCLADLVEVGFLTGSGNIVGLPGQTLQDLVDDLLFLGKYPLAMSSSTVFIPNELSGYRHEQPGDVDVCLNFMALIRILYPDRLIPTTSALEKARPDCQYIGLMAGANTITVHDGTPDGVRSLFPIYSTHRYTPCSAHLLDAVKRSGLKPANQGIIHANYR